MSAQELSSELAGIVERVAPVVVRVEARRWPASGVALSEDTVVTSGHAVEREEEIVVGLHDGTEAQARLVGRDHGTDLAVLKVEAKLQPAAWSEGDGLRVGQLVLWLARPGRTARARLGILGALGGEWRTPAGGKVERYLESDIEPQRGFGGGPLVDLTGSVLGVHTPGLLRGTPVAIPTAAVRRIAAQLQQHGRVRRGYLGLSSQPVRLTPALRERAGVDGGLLVSGVEPDGPAERAGFTLGDVLLKLAGAETPDIPTLLAVLAEDRVGQVVDATVLRAGEVRTLPIAIGQRG